MANKSHKPDDRSRAEVEAYAAVGVPHHDLCKIIGISIKTLLKYYRSELDTGKAKANAQVAKSLFKQAMDGNTSAAIFWLKAQAGWTEKQVIERLDIHKMEILDAGSLEQRLNRALVGRSAFEDPRTTVQ